MKTASVRDLRQNFPRVLDWVNAGEQVLVTRRRERVARLLPYRGPPARRRPLPDLAARLRKVFGRKVIPDRTLKEILERSRGKY